LLLGTRVQTCAAAVQPTDELGSQATGTLTRMKKIEAVIKPFKTG